MATCSGAARGALVRDERGSIPLALLAIIAIGGLVGAMVTTTIAGERAARRDRDFTNVIQGADGGVQAAFNYVARSLADAPVDDPLYGVGRTIGPYTDTTADGSSYTWTATRETALRWVVASTGTRNGEIRTVSAEISDTPLFELAAYAITALTFRGSNGADSYDGAGYFTDCVPANPECRGIVGSNGVVRLNGNAAFLENVDGVHLHNWDVDAGDHRCVGGGRCDDALADPSVEPSARFGPPLVVGNGIDVGFIEDRLQQCRDANAGQLDSLTLPDNGGFLIGPPYTEPVLCVDNLTFNIDVQVAAPVTIYVAGNITFTKGTGASDPREVNCTEGCTPGSTPTAGNLRIYSVGPRLEIGNHSRLAAAIYAPQAECLGDPSNAQADIFGSLVCDRIENQGGWQFHYDTRLGDRGMGRFALDGWQEVIT